MQTLIFMLTLFSSQFTFAHQSQVNQPTAYGYSYGTPAPPNPAENCISDICGPPAQSNLYMTQYLDRLGEYMRLASDPKQIDFPPALAKQFSDLRDVTQKQNDIAVDLFKKSTSLGKTEPDGLSKVLYNVMYASPFLKKVKYKVSTVNGKQVATVDEAATSAELAGMSPDDRSWIMKVGKYFAAASTGGSVSEKEVSSQPPGLLLKMLHPGMSVAEAMKVELSQAQGEATALKGLSPMEKALFFNKTSPDRIAFIASHVADGTVDENETREIIQWNLDYRNNNSLFRNPDSPLMSRPAPPVEDIIAKGGGVDAIAKSFAQDRIADQKKDDDKIQSCKMQYFLNKGLLPSKAQVATLNQDIARSRQMVEEMIKSKFPSSMQQKLIKAVEDADFIAPPTASDFERSFSNSIQQKINAQRANVEDMNNIEPGEMRKLLSVFSLSNANKDPSDSKDDSNDFCDAFKYSPMSDGNYTTYGSIMLSFTTATGDEASRLKTVMHELGHTVSKAIADDPQYADKFASVRKCLADQHTEELPPQIKKSYDEAKAANPKTNGPYVEEDFADTVAGNSGQAVKGRNSWCQFMTLSYDRQQYQESNMQADDGDPHSSSMFRLLDFEMMKKGNVPGSCQKFLATVKYQEHFNSCFDLANPHGASPNTAGAVK